MTLQDAIQIAYENHTEYLLQEIYGEDPEIIIEEEMDDIFDYHLNELSLEA